MRIFGVGGGVKNVLVSFVHFVWLLVCSLFLIFLGYFFKISTYKVEGEAFQFQIYQAVNRHLRWHRCRLFCYQYLGCHSVHFDSFFIVLLNQFSWDCFKLLKMLIYRFAIQSAPNRYWVLHWISFTIKASSNCEVSDPLNRIP